MSALVLRVGSRHRTTADLLLGMWREPHGAPSAKEGCLASKLQATAVPTPIRAGLKFETVPAGTEMVAGMTCVYQGYTAEFDGQWFTDGPARWFVFVLERNQTMLEPVQDYGPMGALVVDDPSGEDVCADA